MTFRSIRVRLTAWYLVILAVGLGLFGVASWFGMRTSAFDTIDDELEDRIQGVKKFMDLQISALSPVEIRDEFREHSVLGPGGDLFQVCNAKGEWLYRSAVLENSQIPIRLPEQLSNRPLYETLPVQNTSVRFATAKVMVNGQPFSVQVAASLKEFNEALDRFRLTLWLSLPLLLLGAGAGGYLISRRALTPVDQITAAAESISIHNLSGRLTVPKTSDELQRLSETLNRMLARLEDSVRRITQFTADASHELRGPVSVIRATAELALQQRRTNGEFQEDMQQVLTEADRTSRLIESLLILARSDAGEARLQHDLIDISVSVREAAEQSGKMAAEKGIQLSTSLPTVPIAVRGDSEALRRLFFILIDNAIKYTPADGRIGVELAARDGFAIVSVADSGMGISESELPYIFDRFWRADKVRSRNEGGAGLGLSIAKWIIDQHHGSITVNSGTGSGATFVVQIPRTSESKQA